MIHVTLWRSSDFCRRICVGRVHDGLCHAFLVLVYMFSVAYITGLLGVEGWKPQSQRSSCDDQHFVSYMVGLNQHLYVYSGISLRQLRLSTFLHKRPFVSVYSWLLCCEQNDSSSTNSHELQPGYNVCVRELSWLISLSSHQRRFSVH